MLSNMKKYTQIQEWERWTIHALLRENRSSYYIAVCLSRSLTTIQREIERNSYNGEYQPAYAEREAQRRRTETNKGRRKLQKDSEMVRIIKQRLKEDKWSPDSITWESKARWFRMVCTQTIYSYIKEQEPSLMKELAYKKGYKKRWIEDKRGKQKAWFRKIAERDPLIEERSRLGDTEADMVVSSWSNRKWWIVTLVDRMSRYLAAEKVPQKQADMVGDVLIRMGKLFEKKNSKPLQQITERSSSILVELNERQELSSTSLIHMLLTRDEQMNRQMEW